MSSLARAMRRLRDPRDRNAVMFVCVALIACEAMVLPLIILTRTFVHIDYCSYIDQVRCYVLGERDYTEIRGENGPLVYPAGFLYVYRAIFALVGGLEEAKTPAGIALAQWVYAGLYVVNQTIVFAVYAACEMIPPWAYVMLCLSKRVHSLFPLRMFNDCVVMVFVYTAVMLLQRRRWVIGGVFLSLGVSVKMSVLLMVPGFLVLLAGGTSFGTTVFALAMMVGVQIALGAPFLLTYPWEYLGKAFEMGRSFELMWSRNFLFVSEDIFLGKTFHISLLLANLVMLLVLAHWRWRKREGGFFTFIRDFFRRALGGNVDGTQYSFTPAHITLVLFESNFVGIVFARSLHPQFYLWYYHTLPLLLWSNPSLPVVGKVAFMCVIEWCYLGGHPSPHELGTHSSATLSMILFSLHLCLLLFIALAPSTPMTPSRVATLGRWPKKNF